MDENTPVNQEPKSDSMGLLEQELAELKKKNLTDPAVPAPARSDFSSPIPVKNGRQSSMLGIGAFFALVVLVLVGFYFLRNLSLPKKISLPVNNAKKAEATATPVAISSPVAKSGTEMYSNTEGSFSLVYPSAFQLSDYTETVNKGIRLVYAPQKGELSEVDDNGLEVKVIYIKGVKGAQNYANTMRGRALYQPDRRNIVSEVDDFTKPNKLTGYFYTISGFGEAEDWYFEAEGGLVRLEAYYNGTTEQTREYAQMFREIVSSLSLI